MKNQTILYATGAVCLMVFSFIFGLILSNRQAVLNKPVLLTEAEAQEAQAATGVYASVEEGAGIADDTAEAAATKGNPNEKITPSTKMVYEYYYLGDGKLESTEEIPPYFLLDMTEAEMRDTFIDWDILTFNKEEVVMRKNVAGKSNQYYVVGEHEGYIAVFYETETNGTTLKEITDMPVSAFSEEEQGRIQSGIHVAGDSELVKVLEDYGS